MEKQKNIEVLKTLTAGELVSLTDGRIAEFVEMKRTKWVGVIDGTRYNIPATMFEDKGVYAAENALLKRAMKQVSRQDEASDKRRQLKRLREGDKIEISSGDTIEFIKLNRTRFVGKEEDGKMYNYPITMFVKLVEKGKEDPIKERAKKLVKKYKGQTIQTVYGPSTVGGLTADGQLVVLYEFGEELYHLSFEDFLEEMETYSLDD